MPTIQLPETTGKECSHRPAYKVSCHKDGVDTVRSAGRKLEDTRLITKLDALHTYINNDNAGNNTYICTFSHIKQQPGEKNQSAADKVEAAYTYLLYVSSYKRCRQRTGYSAESQQSDDVASGEEWMD